MMRDVRSSLLLAAVVLAGCDRQVDSDYQGEPLLRIRGNVTIPLGLEGGDLVPAIAFNAVSSKRRDQRCGNDFPYDHVQIVDVGVTGDFPSNFTLDVFDPPPDEALWEPVPGGPSVAF